MILTGEVAKLFFLLQY